MPVTVRCTNPSCRQRFTIPDPLAGKRGRCTACKETFLLAAEPRQRIGRFEVRAKLGAGAFGTVYRAWDPQLEREVALKVPLPAALDSPRRVERFLREAKAAAGLRHPNLVPVYDAGEDGDTRYIASAFIEGKPLASAVEGEKGIDPRRAAGLVRRLAEGVAYAHQLGIVHRDIKPANVMLDADDRPHLMDFGLAARLESTEKMTRDGAVLGTPAYMAPEQAAGQQGEARPESDQYALGVVLYELIAGRTPFEGPPQIVLFNVIHHDPPLPRKLRPDVPRDLETVCLKAMAKRPEDRYPDCQALADDLGRWLDGEPIRARRLTLVERAVRWVRREPKLAASAGLLAAALLALVTAAGVYLTRYYADRYVSERDEHAATRDRLGAAEALAEAEGRRAEDGKAAAERAKAEVQTGHLAAAQARLAADDPTEAYRTLQRCEARAFPWHQLRLQTEGSGTALRTFRRGPGEEWGGVARIGFRDGELVALGRDHKFVSWD
ncbi:MAG: serine/threonine-protein kinase, partial [Gemmataceae bacterium]